MRLRSRLFPLTLKRTKFIVTRVRVTVGDTCSQDVVKDGVILSWKARRNQHLPRYPASAVKLSAGFIAPIVLNIPWRRTARGSGNWRRILMGRGDAAHCRQNAGD